MWYTCAWNTIVFSGESFRDLYKFNFNKSVKIRELVLLKTCMNFKLFSIVFLLIIKDVLVENSLLFSIARDKQIEPIPITVKVPYRNRTESRYMVWYRDY